MQPGRDSAVQTGLEYLPSHPRFSGLITVELQERFVIEMIPLMLESLAFAYDSKAERTESIGPSMVIQHEVGPAARPHPLPGEPCDKLTGYDRGGLHSVQHPRQSSAGPKHL